MSFDLDTYLHFFGLGEKPFELAPDPRFLYLGEAHQEALARLQYAVVTQKGFLLLTGDVGTGKTLLLNVLQERLNGSFTPIFLRNPRLTTSDLFRTLYVGLEFAGRYRSKAMFLRDLHEQLVRRAADGKNTLLIIDEAQAMSADLLEEIRLLSNLETPRQKLLTIFLVGQPELRDTLSSADLRALSQRINIQYHIQPLDKKNTFGYINTRLKIAGAEHPQLFTRKAVKGIFKHTRGYPRLINILCDNAMISAFVKERRVIDHRMIHEAADDIGIAEKRLALGDPRLSTGRRKPSLIARIFGRA
jgi:general secretion pathway protein A